MNIDFNKGNGLVPVIIQDDRTAHVLMLGYMNEAALEKTKQENKVCFYSRSKQRLWTKGETSGNFLIPKNILLDCDNDTILIKAEAKGPTCHLSRTSCFKDNEEINFLAELEKVIEDRANNEKGSSYTKQLLTKGINKVTQKFGEESVELIIEAKDTQDDKFKEEAADMLYHFMVLLRAKRISYAEIMDVLRARHKQRVN